MALTENAPRPQSRPEIERMADAGALLLLARRRRRMTQQQVARRGGYRSRYTVMRWEQGDLPYKGTPRARDRWLRILGSYGLQRVEADEVLSMLGIDPLRDAEWTQVEARQLRVPPQGKADGPPAGPDGAEAHGLIETVIPTSPLLQHLPDDGRFHVLMGSYGLHMVNAEIPAAQGDAEELLDLSVQLGDARLLLDAHTAMGIALCHLGELSTAKRHLEAGINLYDNDPASRGGSLLLIGNPRVVCASYMGHVLWFLGFPDQARQWNSEALRIGREIEASVMGRTLFYTAALHHLQRDIQQTLDYARSAMSLVTEIGASHWVEKARIMMGWAMANQGRVEDGMESIVRGMARLRDAPIPVELARCRYLTLLADVCRIGGRTEDGLRALEDAKEALGRSSERLWESDLYVVEGELISQDGWEGEAEASFQKALEVSRQQGAKSLELRAAFSLTSLWQRQGRIEHAQNVLAQALGWFTEGFDTFDLKEANAALVGMA